MINRYNILLLFFAILFSKLVIAQNNDYVLSTPPMGFMTWNYFGLDINETEIKEIADAMVESDLRDLGYDYIFIDDGWQGGRDKYNNIIPDPIKFPSGMKDLVDYVHSKNMKIGIYSDAAQLTCGGYTASLGFEFQDAKTFAEWGFDYLKYDYCGAPPDRETAIARYSKMSEALKESGKDIALGICEWGDRKPWLWASKAGGQLWRTTADIRDKWYSGVDIENPQDLHSVGAGIIDILNINAELYEYARPNAWNDPDMLIVGLYGRKGAPSSELNGSGCSDIEYRSQMSLWCLMAAPLMITCDVRNMNAETKEILTNKDIIEINQDKLGKQAKRVYNQDEVQIFVKPLHNNDVAIGVLNTSNEDKKINFSLTEFNIPKKNKAKDLWSKQVLKIRKDQKIKVKIKPHETKVYRLLE